MSKFTPLTDELHSYIVEYGARQDKVLRAVQAETEAMGDVALMQIAPDQGAFMTMMARTLGASQVLEIGTFTGYSAICLARGLEPGGRLLCCDISEEYAAIAARNFERAGVADRIEIRVGPAIETVRAMPGRELFDMAFIDADKTGYPDYYEETLKRLRPGGLVMLDNVLASGSIADAEGPEGFEESHAALRAVNELIAADERVDTAMVAIADGLMIARKR